MARVNVDALKSTRLDLFILRNPFRYPPELDFDAIYLDQVENIKTEQDRLSAMKALENFIVRSTGKALLTSRIHGDGAGALPR